MRGTQNVSRDLEQSSDQSVTDNRGGHGGSLLRAARAGRPAALLALQRQAGNSAVGSIVGSSRTLCRCAGRCTCGGASEAELSEDDRPRRVLARQPAATGADLRCSYEARQIAKWGGPAGKMPLDQVCKDIVTAFTGCDIAYVTIDVVPKASGDDPSGEAIGRAETIKNALIQWIGPKRFAEDRFNTGLSSGSTDGAEVEVWLAGENRGQHGGPTAPAPMGPPEAPTPPAKAGGETEHLGVQGGVGDVRHYYTTPYGPNDALHEWVNQVVAAYTMQRHANNQSGEERQIFAQVQYSLTTKQFTVSFGGQESYVIALPANLQLSFWAQLTAGQNVSGGTSQESLSAGTQLVWQPADWLSFGVQGGVGPTVQSHGPSSIDRSGLLFFQIQK